MASSSKKSTLSTAQQRRTAQFKLVLLGESSVGKSSLVYRFARNQFDDYKESTIGAAFLTQTVPLNETTAVEYEIWDTAGQERYKSLAPMYYRNANCALVVYDITQAGSFARAQAWIQELHTQLGITTSNSATTGATGAAATATSGGGGAKKPIVIVLVGNKLDLAELPDRREVSYEVGQEYAQREGLVFWETSAKTGENVYEMFVELAKHLPVDDKLSEAAAAAAAGGSGKRAVDLNAKSGLGTACQC